MLRHMHMRRLGSWLAVVVASVAVAGCAGHRAPLHYKTGAWDTYAASPTSTLVTGAFYASGAVDRNNPCHQPRRLSSDETATTVTIKLELSAEQGPFSAGEGCTRDARRQTASVTLRAPLNHRRILDAARPSVTPSAR